MKLGINLTAGVYRIMKRIAKGKMENGDGFRKNLTLIKEYDPNKAHKISKPHCIGWGSPEWNASLNGTHWYSVYYYHQLYLLYKHAYMHCTCLYQSDSLHLHHHYHHLHIFLPRPLFFTAPADTILAALLINKTLFQVGESHIMWYLQYSC